MASLILAILDVSTAEMTDITQDVYKALGDTVNQTKLEHMRAQMAGFKEKLEEFAIKHR